MSDNTDYSNHLAAQVVGHYLATGDVTVLRRAAAWPQVGIPLADAVLWAADEEAVLALARNPHLPIRVRRTLAAVTEPASDTAAHLRAAWSLSPQEAELVLASIAAAASGREEPLRIPAQPDRSPSRSLGQRLAERAALLG